MYELRTAGTCRPALPFKLGLRWDCQLYGTTASQVPVLCSSGAQCGSTTCFCGADLRAWSGVFGFSFASFYSGGALLDSRVRNHARVQDCSLFGISLFKRKFSYFRWGTSLLLRKNSPYPFLSDRILYHSRFFLHTCIISFLHFLFVFFIFPLSSSLSSSPLFPLFLFCFLSSTVPKFGNIWYKNYTE